MGVKPDNWIVEMAQKGMITPFESSQVRHGISFGVSAYGYDFRIANEFKMFRPASVQMIDPKNISPESFETFTADECVIPPNGYVLARTVEYFKIPRDVVTICFGKSTYARCGVMVNVTPFEPEWEGYATTAIHNTTSVPVKIYANEGIAQLLFIEATDVCTTSYADKKGKYQAQNNITTAKI